MNLQTISDLVNAALKEDVGSGDITAQLIPLDARSEATIISREQAVICGCRFVDEVFHQVDRDILVEWLVADGDLVQNNQILCRLTGPSRSLLTGERSALNFLQTLSGTATLTRRFVTATGQHKARVLDTRKTIPGLRLAQKYAVKCGGGENHRIGLFDAFLIKENHILAAGSISAAVVAARQLANDVLLEVEVENMHQLGEAIDCGVTRILLDNFSIAELQQAVIFTDHRAELEASGNVDLESIGSVAATGVDYISTGAITKHVTAIDLSMRFIEQPAQQA